MYRTTVFLMTVGTGTSAGAQASPGWWHVVTINGQRPCWPLRDEGVILHATLHRS